MNNDKLVIFDTTLRDGEQSPGASMTKDEKVRIAKALERMRVDVIEAGFPIASQGDFGPGLTDPGPVIPAAEEGIAGPDPGGDVIHVPAEPIFAGKLNGGIKTGISGGDTGPGPFPGGAGLDQPGVCVPGQGKAVIQGQSLLGPGDRGQGQGEKKD